MEPKADNDTNGVNELEDVIDEISEIYWGEDADWGDKIRTKAKELNELGETNEIASRPISMVAIGRTRGRGERKYYALLLGEILPDEPWPYDIDYFDLWDYVAMRFKEAGLAKEAIEDWSARQIAEWKNWLPDPDLELLKQLKKGKAKYET